MSHPGLAKMAWRNLWRNRRRTLITLSSIVFGVFLAILMTALQDRNWADMIDLAARLGGGHVTIQHADYQEMPSLTRTVPDSKKLVDVAIANERVSRAVPRISGQIMLATAGESFGASFVAFDPALEDTSTLSLLEAFANDVALEGRTTGILLGEQLAISLDAELGDRVVYTLTDKEGEIVSGLARLAGILRTGSPGLDSSLALLPISRVREVLSYADDEVTQVAIFLEDHRQSDDVAAALATDLPGDAAALPWDDVQPDLAAFIAMKVGGSIVMELFIAVLVAAGIFNTIFVNVMERLREFGILIAVGFSPGKLFRLVMFESFWLGVVGLVGAAVVTIGPYYYLRQHGIDISARIGDQAADIAGVSMSPILRVGIYPESVFIIASLALLATLLAGIYPAWRAGRVNPVDTIRLV